MSAVGSSCNSLLFSLIFAPLLSLHIFWHSQGWMMGRQDGIKKIHTRECDQKTREFHELLYTEIARLLDSSLVKLTCCNLVNYCIKKCSFFSFQTFCQLKFSSYILPKSLTRTFIGQLTNLLG